MAPSPASTFRDIILHVTRYVAPTETVVVAGIPAALRFRRCVLTIMEGPDKGMEVSLGQRTIRIGTAPENDVILTDRAVSRYHCEIEAREDGFLLRDQASKNGVYIGAVRIKEALLEGTTKLRLANDVIRFAPAGDAIEVQLSRNERFGDALGNSVAMREVFTMLERAAPTDLTVLLEGETGTGKELLAEGLHRKSKRAEKPYQIIDCGAIPRDLIESELFGHTKGSFTGAIGDKKGLFESAEGGTIFLDEIGELDLELQPKLLRVLERGEVRRVGSAATLPVNVRIVAATNRDLLSEVAAGRFRQDLYYRLSVVKVRVPPLRERRDDIPLIAKHIALELTREFPEVVEDSSVAHIGSLVQRYRDYTWPGNVRELRNVIERTLVFHEDQAVPEGGVSAEPGESGAAMPVLRGMGSGGISVFRVAKHEAVTHFERDYLEKVLGAHGNNVSKASRAAGLDRRNFQKLLRKYDMKRGTTGDDE